MEGAVDQQPDDPQIKCQLNENAMSMGRYERRRGLRREAYTLNVSHDVELIDANAYPRRGLQRVKS